jgi:hypothetical protein
VGTEGNGGSSDAGVSVSELVGIGEFIESILIEANLSFSV